ncbi:hypothetical protein ACFV0L_17060 [Streptosporangium canum]|uniref:hypothetical protein n=1 Tax=Streptosporangium canum TaxID=324952 RepID=UPI003679BD88
MHDLPAWIPLAVSTLNLATALISWITTRARRLGQVPGGRTPDELSMANPASPSSR